jgi:hypothetical protein
MEEHEFDRRMLAAASDHAAKVHRNLAQISGAMKAADAELRRKRYAASPAKRAGELGEDRQVGVQPDPIQSTHAQRRERPFVLGPSKLPLDSSSAAIQGGEARSLAGDQRAADQP